MRALISVYDKTGLDDFARGLAGLGWELVSSGGTAAHLESLGLAVTKVEDVTQSPEMLGGRVKTLHPRIHAGILARRDEADDMATLAEHGIEPFDLVCINLYPFETRRPARIEATHRDDRRRRTVDAARGGEELLVRRRRLRHPDYEPVLAELRSRRHLSAATRTRLAAKAFATTAAYDGAIASWFSRRPVPRHARPLAREGSSTSRTARTRISAPRTTSERRVRRHLLSRVEQLNGKELSYNNLNDLSGARALAREFTEPACVIVKHANPCGVAVGESIEEAYDKALASDPVSAYGGVVVLNREVKKRRSGRSSRSSSSRSSSRPATPTRR